MVNKVPIVDVSVSENDETITVKVTQRSRAYLRDIVEGETVKIGGIEFIVLSQGSWSSTTTVVTKEAMKEMSFNGDADWRDSDIREWCNGEFYEKLIETIGKDNFLDIDYYYPIGNSNDGSISENKQVEEKKDKVSIMSAHQYCSWRKHVPEHDKPFWLSTRATFNQKSDSYNNVMYVETDGTVKEKDCAETALVYPILQFKSSTVVD